MQTFQNSRIRVTVSEKTVAKFVRQITPASLGQHETPDQAVRGRILSAAMSKLGNHSELALMRNEYIENQEVIKLAHSILMHRYLVEHSKYDVGQMLFRYENDHRLSVGQSIEIDSANAYAQGLLSPIAKQEARQEVIKYLGGLDKDDIANSRAINAMGERMALLSNTDNASAKWAISEAVNMLTTSKQFEIDYRSVMANQDGWVIEVVGDLPSQIGVCRVTK